MSTFNTPLWNGEGLAAGAITAGGLIYRALRDLAVLRPGQGPSPDALEDGLVTLNELVDSWNTERLIIHTIARNLYDLTAGQTTFTLGDIEPTNARPQRIVAVGILSTGATSERDLPILTLEQHRRGHHGFYSDQAFPYAALTIPAAVAGDQIVIHSWQALNTFIDLETVYDLPPGYSIALRFNLASALAPSFLISAKIPTVLLDRIEEKAIAYKAIIQRHNIPVLYLDCDAALLPSRSFNMLTGR